jgi:hypothetical protein
MDLILWLVFLSPLVYLVSYVIFKFTYTAKARLRGETPGPEVTRLATQWAIFMVYTAISLSLMNYFVFRHPHTP